MEIFCARADWRTLCPPGVVPLADTSDSAVEGRESKDITLISPTSCDCDCCDVGGGACDVGTAAGVGPLRRVKLPEPLMPAHARIGPEDELRCPMPALLLLITEEG